MEQLILRQAAIDALATMYCKSDEDGYVWIIRRDAWARIDALPPAGPKRGKWIEDKYGITICSECRKPRRDNRIDHIGWCNACGAKMEVTE